MLELNQLSFAYSCNRQSVLESISVKLEPGQIYGLLGPSGHGKTTLLRLILGRLSATKGTIRMFGRLIDPSPQHRPSPAWFGYMPQECVLYGQFKSREMLTYFARLYDLDPSDTKQRVNHLLSLLRLLDTGDQKIMNMSGGQQRRVSLAVALLHQPSLLLLDEPTVGMDPVLRQIIWKHLKTLASDKHRAVSVLLTTHYIEEAREADVVGFLRHGRLLAQASPKTLLERENATTLEAVFLSLCCADVNNNNNNNNARAGQTQLGCDQLERKQTTNSEGEDAIHMNRLAVGHFKVVMVEDYQTSPPPSKKTYTPHWLCVSHLTTLVHKNVRQMVRSWPLLIFFLLLPAIEMSLIMMCIGRNIDHISVAVYNGEQNHDDLSAIFLASIPEHAFELKYFNTPEQAIQAVQEGQAAAFLEFSPKFSEALRARFFNLATSETDEDGDEGNKTSLGLRLWNDSSVYVRVDNANQLVGLQVKRQLLTTFLAFAQKLATSLGLSNNTFRPPVAFGPPIYGLAGSAVVETYIAPGALIMIAFFATTIVSCHLLLQEMRQGLIERALLAGVSTAEFLGAHVITQTVVLGMQLVLMLWTSFQLFCMPYLGSLPLGVSLVSLQGVCGLMYGLMLSATCVDEVHATTLAIGTFFPSVIMAGIFWPLEAMPTALQYISHCLPSTQSITALRDVLLKNWGLERRSVAGAFGVSSFWLFIFLALALYNFHRRV